jgi:transposase
VTEAEDVQQTQTAPAGAIHIELPGEIRISLEGSVDAAVVRAVLKSLRS